MSDCGFTVDGYRFRYRAAAIIVENGCVLFAGNRLEDYLYSVGGAVHLGETAEDAVRREVFEETGVRYDIDRLAVIHESFYDADDGRSNVCSCHEVCLYFLMKPRGTVTLDCHGTTLGGVKEEMHWVPIHDLEKYKAFPSFMKAYLEGEHPGIQHIVTDERNCMPRIC